MEVWQKAIDYAQLIIQLIEDANIGRKHYRLVEQNDFPLDFIC